ncbi:hypothetical protein BGZ83_005075 [Gryganskiella cystojenkinii]|nr:hypothetical protein BGZ83_005075 [Gryganskiella cystojenkinii]
MDDDNSSTLSTSHSDSMEAEEVVLSPEDVELGNNIPLVDIKSIFANYSTILAPRFPPSPSPQSPEWSLNQPNTEQEPLAAVPEARSNLSGRTRGLGIGTVTLNWAYISDLLPLLTPWWVQANMIAGMFLISYLASGWGYYSDVFEAKSYPILGTSLYSKNGSLYNGSQVVHHENWTLNEQAYEDYGPMFDDSTSSV